MKLLSSALAGTIFSLLAATTSAAIVSVNGADVRFTYDDSTLYGSGTVVGNAIVFIPTDFIASSANGAVTTISDILNLQIEIINPSAAITGFQLIEQGDYFFNNASTTAQATGAFQVSSNTNSHSSNKNFDADPLNDSNSLTEWSTSSTINLADTAGWSSDTDVAINITNVLATTTLSLGDISQIQKKFVGVGVEVAPVPVPAALWLFGSALVGLIAIKRKK